MKKAIILLFILLSEFSYAQDLPYAKKMLNTLTSKKYWGRGYTRDGMKKAGDFLEKEFNLLGLVPLGGDSYKQSFFYPVNTFPGKMSVAINGQYLVPGKDFIVGTQSLGVDSKTELLQKDSVTYISGISKKIELRLLDKLTWSVAGKTNEVTQILTLKKAIVGVPRTINISVENKFIPNFEAANICGLVPGTLHPDSIIIITAHYDHLGGMGKRTYFPGANDNASGVSFLLSLAKYYAKHPQKYSVGFICFAGEEAGLLGSKFFTEHPLVPLSNIRFLINLDLVGTGSGGMTVVNSTVYPSAFKELKKINDSLQLFNPINQRGKAANSDHYWFTEKGVPAFFIYTQGGPSAYHDIYDRPETLPLTKYNELFSLITNFNTQLMSGKAIAMQP